MNSYYLQIEAVNFDSFIDDTSDLSTRRGGGLLLLDAPKAIEALNLTQVYSGASAALFRFDADSDGAAHAIRKEAERLLHEDSRSEATILVTCERAGGEERGAFQKAVRTLQNRTRWTHLQSPSVVYPKLIATDIDEIDDIRPARPHQDFRKPPENDQEGEGKPWILSNTTCARRKHGIGQKHLDFYQDRAAWPDSPWSAAFPFHPGEYVNDLNHLADHPGKGRVRDKIAVIYLDGNKFGKVGSSCLSEPEYTKWSERAQANQNSFLHWLLSLSASPGEPCTSWHWSGDQETNTGRKVPKERAFRIETLLWGGDEIIWVVPAWCGWWLVGEFFRLYGQLPWKNPQSVGREYTAGGATYRLTHGAGIVFCHAKASIHRVASLAKNLAHRPKELGTRDRETTEFNDLFTYQVLESFDHLGARPEDVRKQRLPAILREEPNSADSLVLAGDGMPSIIAPMKKLRDRFPRSKLHTILERYTHGDNQAAHELAEEELARADVKTDFAVLQGYFGNQFKDREQLAMAATWMHVAELWDYTPEPDWQAPPIDIKEQ